LGLFSHFAPARTNCHYGGSGFVRAVFQAAKSLPEGAIGPRLTMHGTKLLRMLLAAKHNAPADHACTDCCYTDETTSTFSLHHNPHNEACNVVSDSIAVQIPSFELPKSLILN
jgi:hypothetical protein